MRRLRMAVALTGAEARTVRTTAAGDANTTDPRGRNVGTRLARSDGLPGKERRAIHHALHLHCEDVPHVVNEPSVFRLARVK